MTQMTTGLETPRRSTMTRLEKRFVNSDRKGRAVARRLNALLEQVSPPPGSRYLDVGAGNGAATTRVATEWRLDATGVDLDPEQIALARARDDGGRPVGFVEADARRLPFADGEFDLVTSSKATHHIPEWEDALAEMCRVLRPGGHLVYADLALPRPLARLAGGFGRHPLPTRAALDATFERLGLAVVDRRRGPFVYEAVLQKA
jgi:ubiquinone/menaquinone biosynthesis C-methylase UbiE